MKKGLFWILGILTLLALATVCFAENKIEKYPKFYLFKDMLFKVDRPDEQGVRKVTITKEVEDAKGSDVCCSNNDPCPKHQ